MDGHAEKGDGEFIQEYATFRTIRSEGGLDGTVWAKTASTEQ